MNMKITEALEVIETLAGLIYEMADTGLEMECPSGASLEACREAAELLEALAPMHAKDFTALANDIEAFFDNN